MSRSRAATWITVFALILFGSGCSAFQSSPLDVTWTEAEPQDLSTTKEEQLARARSAREEMFKSLVGRLTAAVDREGFAGAIDVCANEAPEIRREVRNKYRVTIGRTSFRLRNPKNDPPWWARPYVSERRKQPLYLQGDEGSLAVLSPIFLQPLCANCHGPEDQLAPGVKQALDTRYPEDRATGFRPGDLRGWFWVEVPPASDS